MSGFLPLPASAHAAEIDLVLLAIHILIAVIFAGWGVYFIWVLVRFRRGRQPHADHTGATGRATFWTEIGVVAAELVLLVGLALPIWFNRIGAAPSDADSTIVRLVSEQFIWNAHYPGPDRLFGATSLTLVTGLNPIGLDRDSAGAADDVVVQNQLHLPVNRPAVIQLSSKDVVHSFGVPTMRVKQDAIPGLMTSAWFTPTRTGTFDIVCSQLCGMAHFRMRAVLTVESADAFNRFLASERALQ